MHIRIIFWFFVHSNGFLFVHLDCLWTRLFRSSIIHGFPRNWYSYTRYPPPVCYIDNIATNSLNSLLANGMYLLAYHLPLYGTFDKTNSLAVALVLTFVCINGNTSNESKCRWLSFGRNFVLANKLLIDLIVHPLLHSLKFQIILFNFQLSPSIVVRWYDSKISSITAEFVNHSHSLAFARKQLLILIDAWKNGRVWIIIELL